MNGNLKGIVKARLPDWSQTIDPWWGSYAYTKN